MVSEIHVFGDSHSTYFFPSDFYVGRLGLKHPQAYKVTGEAISAASIMGFRPRASTLDTKKKIEHALPNASRMVFAFGQVDLELGFYFRKVVKGEDVDVEQFCAFLLESYREFVSGVAGKVDLAVKGVNLTALSPRNFAIKYISGIITGNNDFERSRAEQGVRDVVMAERQQNEMHILFNSMLREMCASLGVRYFDIVSETATGGVAGATMQYPRLSDVYKTSKFDHHFADTVEVRKIHYFALGRVFGFL
ncbi:hypothetical protein [Salipiger bermudensis]|uniref:hypothetical protein n=1 Tax=Salipiger bermudensis TaxID=344736 RepID=UPI00300883AB